MKKKINKINDTNKMRIEVNALRKSVLNLRFQKATGQLEKTSELRKLKKRIAKLLTNIDQHRKLTNV
jgi:ribosomal protein L29